MLEVTGGHRGSQEVTVASDSQPLSLDGEVSGLKAAILRSNTLQRSVPPCEEQTND